MQKYTSKITLEINKRGVWGLDPFKGCLEGLSARYIPYDCGLNKMFDDYDFNTINKRGCYGICYAAKNAKFRGHKFNKTQKRDFKDSKHFDSIAKKLSEIPFVRLGVNCDPSSDWEHTLNITDKIKPFIKNIVIITKHWNELSEEQLHKLNGMCVNTSISALDNKYEIDKRMFWYNTLKDHCKSVLRVNTADFNDGKLKLLQNNLLNNENVIDNILRFNKGHELVVNGIVNIKRYKFLDKYSMASKHDENIYFGYCDKCPDQCGINT